MNNYSFTTPVNYGNTLGGYGFSPSNLMSNGYSPDAGFDWSTAVSTNPNISNGFNLKDSTPMFTGGYGNLGSYGAPGNAGGGFFDGMSGAQKFGFGMDAIGKLAGLYMGLQQYGLAKKAFDLQKESFERQYAAQRDTTNTRMEDRQRARVAANPGAYESVGSYMDRNRIS